MVIGIDDYLTVPAIFLGTEKDHVVVILVVFLLSLVTAMVLTEIHNQSR